VTAASFGDLIVTVLGFTVLAATGLLILLVILRALRFPPVVRMFARLRRRQTRKHMRIAESLGLTYVQDDDFGLLDLPLSLVSWGMRRWINQVTYGAYRGRDVWLFRLYYTVPGGKYGPTMSARRGVVARIDAAFPHVVIERRTILEAKQMIVGFEDEMQLDPEFDEEFRVRSTDPELAADILDVNVRRWMPGLDKHLRFEISGPWVLAYEESSKDHLDERQLLDTVSEFADRLPWILQQQHPAGSEPDPDPMRVGPPPPTEEQLRKQRSPARWVAWVVGTLLFLFAGGVVVALTTGPDDDGPHLTVAPPSIPPPTFVPPSISLPPLPTSDPGPTPTLTAAPSEALVLAGIQDGEEVTVTFLGLQPLPHPTFAPGAPSPEDERLGAEFLIRNTGTVAYEDFPANGITLVDEGGREYTPSLLDAFEPGFGTIHLAPGERVRGFVTFEVPAGAMPVAVFLTTDSGFGPQAGRWDL